MSMTSSGASTAAFAARAVHVHSSPAPWLLHVQHSAHVQWHGPARSGAQRITSRESIRFDFAIGFLRCVQLFTNTPRDRMTDAHSLHHTAIDGCAFDPIGAKR